MDVDFDVLQSRIETRSSANIDEIRADDTADILVKRLKEYETQTAPLGQFYSGDKKFTKINGMNSINEVSLDIKNFLDNGI